MKFCCSDFEGHYYVENQVGPNFRIVRFTSPVLTGRGDKSFFAHNPALFKTKHKRNDIRFFITMGYERFSLLETGACNIAFCPYCGTNLYDFYVDDECANEVEGKTFDLGLIKR